MTQEPYLADLRRGRIVLDAIHEVCRFRDWGLIAGHVRTTHVHLVVDGPRDPDRAILDFKRYASRALNASGLDPADRKRWERGGSSRHLVTDAAVSAGVKYVIEKQGAPMAVYMISPR